MTAMILPAVAWLSVQTVAQECVDFRSNGRLQYDAAYTTNLPRGFQLHLNPVPLSGRPADESYWIISIRRPGTPLDFMWIVNPPFRSGRHREIGADDSLSVERRLRFVLTEEDYYRASKVIDAAPADVLKELERLGKGSLTLKVTGFALRRHEVAPGVDVEGHEIDWIEFSGRACVPKEMQ